MAIEAVGIRDTVTESLSKSLRIEFDKPATSALFKNAMQTSDISFNFGVSRVDEFGLNSADQIRIAKIGDAKFYSLKDFADALRAEANPPVKKTGKENTGGVKSEQRGTWERIKEFVKRRSIP